MTTAVYVFYVIWIKSVLSSDLLLVRNTKLRDEVMADRSIVQRGVGWGIVVVFSFFFFPGG